MDHLKEELASEDDFKGVADHEIQAPSDDLVKKFYTVIRITTMAIANGQVQPK
jgi:hypothetical protein